MKDTRKGGKEQQTTKCTFSGSPGTQENGAEINYALKLVVCGLLEVSKID